MRCLSLSPRWAISIIRCASKSRVPAARSSAANGLPDVCNDSHAVSKADAKVFVVPTSNECFPRSLSIDIISLFFLDGSLSACQVSLKSTDIKYFTTFGNVGKQDFDKWDLAIERCPPLIFCGDDPLDSRKIELA